VELLGGQGASLETAVNGEAAVQRFSESVPGHYTLILMDIQMPTNILKTSLTVSPPGWMFLIIMPGCDSAAAAKRLEGIRSVLQKRNSKSSVSGSGI